MNKLIKIFSFLPVIIQSQIVIVGDTTSAFIYYNRINVNVPPASWSTTSLSIDVDGDNIKDFTFSSSHSQSPSHYHISYACNALNGFELVATATAPGVIDTIGLGTPIDYTLNWKNTAYIMYIYSQNPPPPWGAGTSTLGLFKTGKYYFGFRKKIMNDTIYGWFYVTGYGGVISYAIEKNCSYFSQLAVSTTSNLICSNETVTLNVTGASSYTWSSGSTGSVVIVTPTATTTYTVSGSTTTGCILNSTFTQSVDACAGINELKNIENNILIYPNPSSEKLFVKNIANTEIKKYSLLSIEGKEISLKQIGKEEFDVSDLPKGLYFLQLQTKEGVLTKKIIVGR